MGASHTLALIQDNPNANLAPILTHDYLSEVSGLTSELFKYGNGGLVLCFLKIEDFDDIADKYIEKGGTLRDHRSEMKTEWDKKAVEEIKKRSADDKLIAFMLHWA